MAKPTQVARAVTPSQPTCGTGRGKSGRETSRWRKSTRLRNPSAIPVVSWMTGLVSREAMIQLRNSVNSSMTPVRSRPLSVRVSSPFVKVHATAHATRMPSSSHHRDSGCRGAAGSGASRGAGAAGGRSSVEVIGGSPA
jgi:hypothetical protein